MVTSSINGRALVGVACEVYRTDGSLWVGGARTDPTGAYEILVALYSVASLPAGDSALARVVFVARPPTSTTEVRDSARVTLRFAHAPAVAPPVVLDRALPVP